jgi:predicted nucleic acid-binding protein
MPAFLLDTSVIIDAINNKKDRRQLLRELLHEGNILACCPINVTEVYAGMRPAERTAHPRIFTDPALLSHHLDRGSPGRSD